MLAEMWNELRHSNESLKQCGKFKQRGTVCHVYDWLDILGRN